MTGKNQGPGRLLAVGTSLFALSLLAFLALGAKPLVANWLDEHVGVVEGEWGDEIGAEPEVLVPELPQGEEEPWIVASGGTGTVGAGTLYRYRVVVESATGLDPAAVADVVDFALGHPRGWTNDGVAFQRVDGGAVDMVVRVATPDTVDRLCAPLETNGQVSCRNGTDVVLNQLRWENGVDAYAGDIEGYRVVLVNHEVGHFIGHKHVPCPGDGQPAPVMMQLYYDGLQGCAANIWPYAEDGSFIG